MEQRGTATSRYCYFHKETRFSGLDFYRIRQIRILCSLGVRFCFSAKNCHRVNMLFDFFAGKQCSLSLSFGSDGREHYCYLIYWYYRRRQGRLRKRFWLNPIVKRRTTLGSVKAPQRARRPSPARLAGPKFLWHSAKNRICAGVMY